MPRIDGYPSADPLTGNEVLPGMQGGATKSISLTNFTAFMQAALQPIIAQQVAAALALGGGGPALLMSNAVLGRAVLGRAVLGRAS